MLCPKMDTTVRYCVQRMSEKMAAKTALERERATLELHRYLEEHGTFLCHAFLDPKICYVSVTS